MRKVLVSVLALAAALSLLSAPASAQPRNHGFGLAAFAAGLIGGVVAAEIASHSRHEPECRTRTKAFYDEDGDYRGAQKVTVCRD